jgi:hypothetical protein
MERIIPTVIASEDHDCVVALPQGVNLVEQDLEVAVDHLNAVPDGTAV